MRSIALFPCSYTDGALLVGELATTLRLHIYTDEMLFADISRRFRIPEKTLRRMIFGSARQPDGNPFEKEIFVDLAKRTLAGQRRLFSGRRMFFGLHTSLLDAHLARVIKVLVVDEEERRVQRAMRQEGFSPVAAREVVRRYDRKASAWTRFLFAREPYDPSLYDVVVSGSGMELIRQIVQHYEDIESWFGHYQEHRPEGVADGYFHAVALGEAGGISRCAVNGGSVQTA